MVKALKRTNKTCIYKIAIEWEAKKRIKFARYKKIS